MRRSAIALLLPASLVLAGCFQGERLIRVNGDGSGTVEDTLVMGPQMRALMAMAAQDQDAAKRKAKLDAAASAMGPGVKAVSEELSDDRLKAVYAFEDVSKLTLDVSPGPPGDSEPSDAGQQTPLTFRFARHGERSVLTVVQPRPEKPEGQAAAEAEAPEGMPDLAQGMWGMMKGMLKGLKLRTSVVVNGELVETNAQHGQGPTVTLLEMDFDAITADDANFEKFTHAGNDPASMDPELLQGVAGIKVNPEREVVIEFRGR